MTPEGKVKQYLCDRVIALGGHYRYVKWLGRNHAPDLMIKVPGAPVTLVETKAPGKRPRPGQVREHQRLRDLFDFRVLTLPTCEDVDREFPEH